MKVRTIFFICAISWNVFAGSLSSKEIAVIQQEAQALSDEIVTADEVAVIETDFGTIVFEFFPLVAPIHAMNFKKLANFGYYDSTTFHRVVPGFMIQGGDILSRDDNQSNDGSGGPGYTIQAEFGKRHVRGAVATARLPDQVNPEKRSNGSQFYICVKDQSYLDRMGYTVFGQVIKGMDVVDRIVSVKRNSQDRPLKDVVMKRVYISTKKELKLR